MTNEQRIARLEQICRTQQRVIDACADHLNAIANVGKRLGVDLPNITIDLSGSESSALDAARRL